MSGICGYVGPGGPETLQVMLAAIGEAKARLLDRLAPLGLVRRDWLERLLAGKLGGLRPRRGAKIWLLLTLEAWLRRVFAGTT